MNDIEYLQQMCDVILEEFGKKDDLCKLVIRYADDWMAYYTIGKNNEWVFIDDLSANHTNFSIAVATLRLKTEMLFNDSDDLDDLN